MNSPNEGSDFLPLFPRQASLPGLGLELGLVGGGGGGVGNEGFLSLPGIICFCLMSKQGQLWNVGSFLPFLGSKLLLFEIREGLGQGQVFVCLFVFCASLLWTECLCKRPPHNSYIEALPLNMMLLGGGPLRGN